jgi:aspartokinase
VLPLAAEIKMLVWVRNTFNPQARGTRIGSPRSFSETALEATGPVPKSVGVSVHGGAA